MCRIIETHIRPHSCSSLVFEFGYCSLEWVFTVQFILESSRVLRPTRIRQRIHNLASIQRWNWKFEWDKLWKKVIFYSIQVLERIKVTLEWLLLAYRPKQIQNNPTTETAFVLFVLYFCGVYLNPFRFCRIQFRVHVHGFFDESRTAANQMQNWNVYQIWLNAVWVVKYQFSATKNIKNNFTQKMKIYFK